MSPTDGVSDLELLINAPERPWDNWIWSIYAHWFLKHRGKPISAPADSVDFSFLHHGAEGTWPLPDETARWNEIRDEKEGREITAMFNVARWWFEEARSNDAQEVYIGKSHRGMHQVTGDESTRETIVQIARWRVDTLREEANKKGTYLGMFRNAYEQVKAAGSWRGEEAHETSQRALGHAREGVELTGRQRARYTDL